MDMNEKLSDKVTMDILEMITIQKRFGPGDQLPNENDLAAELGVSRTTLREAENNLVAQKILGKKRGKGTFVIDNNNLRDDMGLDNLDYVNIQLSDLYELRMALEPSMAGIAANKATDQEIAFIVACAEKMEAPGVGDDKIIEYNRQFHNAIARATHNEFMFRLFDNISSATVSGFNVEHMKEVFNEDMIRTHRLVTECIRLRDSEGAAQAMRIHLKYSVIDFNISAEC